MAGRCRGNLALPSGALRHQEDSKTRCKEILLIPAHRWKDLSMDFATGLPISTDWKGSSYDSILANTYPLLERLIDGFRDWIAYIYGLEGHQLRLKPGYCRSADEGPPFQDSRQLMSWPTALRDLMTTSRENLHHAQELQKRAHDKGAKPRSYAPGEKFIHNVFHVSLLAEPDAIILITAPAASNNKEIALPALKTKGFQLASFIPSCTEYTRIRH